MISFYILEEYIDRSWFKIREFSSDELDLALAYIKIYKSKYRLGRFRLVGVYNV